MSLSRDRTTINHRRNRSFVGRDDLLAQMHERLCGKQASDAGLGEPGEPVSCLLHGLGGSGKTQTALEYCYRYQNEYKWQFWITAETLTKLLDSFRVIANRLPPEARVSQDTVTDTLVWLEATDDEWLVVFDNVEDWDSVFDIYAPRKCRGRSAVILTSQLTEVAEVDHVFKIDSLSIEEGAQLLGRQVYGRGTMDSMERSAALEISHKFSGLPLALAHIGGFVKESGSSLVKYEDKFNSRQPVSWRGKTHATHQYEKPMEVVWEFALSDAELSAATRNLIQILAFLDPDGVPESMLLKFCQERCDWGFTEGAEEAELLAMLRALRKRSLISIETKRDGSTFVTMHRSLQHAILLQLDGETVARERIFSETIRALEAITPKPSPFQTPKPENWPQLEVVIPHIISLCGKFVKSVPQMRGTMDFAKLLYSGGFFLWERQDPATLDAVQVFRTALDILDEAKHAKDDRLRANILTIYALVRERLGPMVYADVRDMRTEARKIRETIKEKEKAQEILSPVTDRLFYNSINEQGISELYFNQFSEAERSFEICLTKYKTWGSEDDIPFEYAKYNHNMGVVKMCQGRFSEALKLEERGVALQLKSQGSRNSRVAWFDFDFACTVFQAGDSEKALEMHLEILREREQTGKYAEATLNSYYAVGAVYHHLGKLEEAKRYMKESIDRASTVGRKRWPECALGRACLHYSRILSAGSASEEEVEPYKREGERILAKYRGTVQQLMEIAKDEPMDDLVLYDSLQPVFNGRYTGRDLVPLLQKMAETGG